MTQRHPDAFEPFTDDEFEAVCEAADTVTLYLGRGWSARPDPEFAGQLVRLWGRTGIHPSAIGLLGPQNLRDDVLTWVRPKTRRRVTVPLHHTVLPWIRDYLSKERPAKRWAYSRMLRRIGQAVREREGVEIHVSPMRFRHYAARSLLDLGLDPVIVGRLLQVSQRTLTEHYGALSTEAIKDKLRAAGF